MISFSDIFSFFNFIKPEKIIINCSLNKTPRLGEYEFVIKNFSRKSIKVIKLLVNDKDFPEYFSVSESYKKFPINFTPLQEIKYSLFLIQETHFELPKTSVIVYKNTFGRSKTIKQIL
jgi:hypothetical protein